MDPIVDVEFISVLLLDKSKGFWCLGLAMVSGD